MATVVVVVGSYRGTAAVVSCAVEGLALRTGYGLAVEQSNVVRVSEGTYHALLANRVKHIGVAAGETGSIVQPGMG